jgi:hypothetical protein
MFSRGNKAARPDLGVLTDLDGSVAEEAAEAVEGGSVADGDPTLGPSSDIDGILE